MAYEFWLDATMLPVAPSKVTVKIAGKNKTVTLINEGDINILKMPGLTDVSFTALLPNMPYPFAQYSGAGTVLAKLEQLKTRTDDKGKFLPFDFKITRTLPNGTPLHTNSFKMSLEDYKITDDTKQGFDFTVDIALREYRDYGTAKLNVKVSGETVTASVEKPRLAENPPAKAAHTVAKGDSLWAIAKKYLGDGSRYPEIYELNKAEIDARNKGTGNTRYTIYPGQTFKLP
jgi:nucleoid-associated protein YgaU